MNLDYRLLKQFADVVNNPDVKDENVTLTGTAKVLEDGKYVQIDGSETITPVYETVDVQEGDRVLVKIENHRAIVTGNLSYPPSARKEQEAIDKADGAQQTADQSKEDSDLAKQQAQEAQQSAKDALDKASQSEAASNEAMQAANEAQTAADNASQKADAVAGIANAANEKAQAAQDAALGAQESVSEARNEMELIRQDVTGVQGDIDDALTELGNLASEQDSIKIDMETNYAKKTDLSDVEASLKTEIDVAVGELQTTISQEYAAKSEVTEIEGKLQTQITQNAEGISQTASKVEKIESDTADAIQAVDEAKQQAQEAKAYADAAQEDANLAKAEADLAKAEADKAKERAQAAQDAATNANLAAVEADQELTEAKTALDEAKENYNNVVNKPGATAEEIAAAQELVDNAQLAVNNALAKAATAIAAAKKAQEAAATAQNEAQEAQGVANTAISKADNAQTVADNALSAAQQAQEEVAELTRKVTTMETSIKQNAEAIELNANKTTEIGTKLDNLEIGGRNLIIGSSSYTKDKPFSNTSSSTDAIKTMPTSVYMPCTPGETYTFQCKTDGKWGNHIIDGSGTGQTHLYLYLQTQQQVGTGEWARPQHLYSETFNGKTGLGYWKYTIPTDNEYVRIIFRFDIHSNGTTSYTVNWWDLKAEKGNVATDWTPAPEDIENELVNNYYTKTQTDAQIKVSADNIKQEVNKTVTTEISNAVNNIEIGGRNIVIETKSFKERTDAQLNDGWTFNGFSRPSIDENGFQIIKATASGLSSSQWLRAKTQRISVTDTNNKKYLSISVWFMTDDWSKFDIKCILSTNVYNKGGGRLGWFEPYLDNINKENYIKIEGYSHYLEVPNGTWARYIFKLPMNLVLSPSPGGASDDIIPSYFDICLNLPRNGTVYFKKMKAEYGTEATDWTPAPEDVTAEIDDIQVGGRNLFLDSGTLETSMFRALDTFAFTYNIEDKSVPSNNVIKATLNSLGTLGSHGLYFLGTSYIDRIIKNKTYTASYYVKSNRIINNVQCMAEWLGDKSYLTRKYININTEWQRVELTDIANKGYDWETTDGGRIALTLYSQNFLVGDIIYLSSPKVEIGNKATDWSPAPEDIESSAHDYTDSSINAATSSIIESYTSLINATAKEIDASVSELKTTINGQNTTIEGLTNQLEITTEMAQFVKTTTEKLEDAVSGKISESEIREWARFDGAKLELGATNSAFKAILSNTELAFYQNENKVAWISNNQLYILTAIIAKSIGCGNFTFVDEGSLGFSLI